MFIFKLECNFFEVSYFFSIEPTILIENLNEIIFKYQKSIRFRI